MASIFLMVDSQNEAAEITAKLASISGENNKILPSDFNLIRRVNITQPNKAKILSRMKIHDYVYKKRYPKNLRKTDSISETVIEVDLTRLVGVQVDILVDETGKVIEAKGKSEDAKANQKAESEVAKLVFKPFIYNGIPKKMRGYIVYEYMRNN